MPWDLTSVGETTQKSAKVAPPRRRESTENARKSQSAAAKIFCKYFVKWLATRGMSFPSRTNENGGESTLNPGVRKIVLKDWVGRILDKAEAVLPAVET